MTLIINLDFLLETHGYDGINYDLDNLADMLLVIDELNKIIDRLMIIIKKLERMMIVIRVCGLTVCVGVCVFILFLVCVCVSIYFFSNLFIYSVCACVSLIA